MKFFDFGWPVVEPEMGFIAEARRAPARWELDEPDEPAYPEWAPHTAEWEPYVIMQRTAEGDPSGWELRHLYIEGLTWRSPLEDRRPRLWLAYASVKTEADIVAFVRRFGPMVGEDLVGAGKRVELRYPRHDGYDYYGATVASCLSAAERLRDQRDLWRQLRGEMDGAEARGDISCLKLFVISSTASPVRWRRSTCGWSGTIHAARSSRSWSPHLLKRQRGLSSLIVVSGNVGLKPCERCGGLFELDPKQTRNDRKFCSSACKQSAWRESRRAEGCS